MKALVFVIAISIGFISLSFAQNCGITEAQAKIEDSYTWQILRNQFELENQPQHWRRKTAKYWINEANGPSGAISAIKNAANAWSNSTWENRNDFEFDFQNTLGHRPGRIDRKSLVGFHQLEGEQQLFPAITTILTVESNRRKDRIKEVDTTLNTRYYWATGAEEDKMDIESVMAHEFGHWLRLQHLWPGDEGGCDEFKSSVMYYKIGKNTEKRTHQWMEKWGKWYIYSSGHVNMAPMAMPMEFPPAMQNPTSVLQTELLHNYPDPFNPETWIPYQLASEADVNIEIYDLGGVLIRHIAIGEKAPGSYLDRSEAVHWDGKDDKGRAVSSGVYFYTLHADDFSQTKRMVILK